MVGPLALPFGGVDLRVAGRSRRGTRRAVTANSMSGLVVSPWSTPISRIRRGASARRIGSRAMSQNWRIAPPARSQSRSGRSSIAETCVGLIQTRLCAGVTKPRERLALLRALGERLDDALAAQRHGDVAAVGKADLGCHRLVSVPSSIDVERVIARSAGRTRARGRPRHRPASPRSSRSRSASARSSRAGAARSDRPKARAHGGAEARAPRRPRRADELGGLRARSAGRARRAVRAPPWPRATRPARRAPRPRCPRGAEAGRSAGAPSRPVRRCGAFAPRRCAGSR